MSISKHSSTQKSKALQQFSKGLPDAKITPVSTIQKQFIIEDRTITFLAQKAKGNSGMTWRITYN